MRKGKVFLIISAFVYGFTPILAKTAYSGGADGVSLAFLRSSLCLPLLFIILLIKRIPLRMSTAQTKKTILVSLIGNAMSIIFLYVAYDFISIGLAMVLHFIYPLIIVVICAMFFGERLGVRKYIAVALVTVGLFMFTDINSRGDAIGVGLAILSGVFYAFNVIYLDKSGLDRVNYMKLTFYISLFMSIAILFFILVSRNISFDLTPQAWIYSAVISVIITLVGLPLFQRGVYFEGAATAGIISTVEPITGVILGAIFLGEKVSAVGIAGCALILLGVVMVETDKRTAHSV